MYDSGDREPSFASTLSDADLKLSAHQPMLNTTDTIILKSATKEIELDESRDLRLGTADRSWVDRTFSRLTPGSLRGSTFTLLSTALGSGMLSLPYMMYSCGLVLGTLFLVLNGLCGLWSLYLLSKTAFRSGTKVYSDAVREALGPAWEKIFGGMLVFYCFGSLVSYFISINQFIIYFLSSINAIDVSDSQNWVNPSSSEYFHTYIIISSVAILAYPVACMKNLSAFRYLTIFGVTIVSYITIVVFGESFSFASNNNTTGEIQTFIFSWDTIIGWSICTYAYTCHANVFPIRSELQRAKDGRMKKISNRVISTLIIIYCTIAISGYISVPVDTPQIFINRLPPTIWNSDILITVAKAAMAFNLFFCLPLNLSPCRLQVLLLMKKDPGSISNTQRIVITFIILFSAAILSMFIPNVTTAIGILGGLCSTSLCSTFPTLLYLKFTKMRKDHWKRSAVWAIGISTAILGYSSAVIVILKLVGVIN